MYGPTLSYGINYGHPVNWASPLNNGLVSWWTCLPNWMGGATWRDLCNRNHGTLTLMDPATDWVGTSRRGGYGALDTDGSNDYVTATTSMGSSTEASIGGWVYRSTTGIKNSFGLNTGASFRLNVLWFTDNKIYYQVDASFPSLTSTATGWRHLMQTYNGGVTTKLRLYLDGVEVANSTSGPTSLNASAHEFWVGREQSNGYCVGQYDDIQLFNKELSASQVWGIYRDSLMGSPQRLNRIRRPLAFDTGAGGGGGGGPRRRRLLLCGARAA